MSAPLLDVVLPGRVVAKQRPRGSRRGSRMTFRNSETHRRYLQAATEIFGAMWRGKEPLDEAVTVQVDCYFCRPQRLRRVRHRGDGPLPYVGTPDSDNAAGLPLDGLVRAGVLRDDSRVSDLIVHRRWIGLDDAGRDEAPEHTRVRLWRWADRRSALPASLDGCGRVELECEVMRLRDEISETLCPEIERLRAIVAEARSTVGLLLGVEREENE